MNENDWLDDFERQLAANPSLGEEIEQREYDDWLNTLDDELFDHLPF